MKEVLGINASPRIRGNSRFLMSLFTGMMEQKGYETKVLNATDLEINPCIGCGHCETKGVCVFKDDFSQIVLPEIMKADIIAIGSPVYFYAFPAKIKALIDRIQVMWSRKYRLKLDEFSGRTRKGVLMAVGATGGKDLFDGLDLTARYFFDAADISSVLSLCYRNIDEKGGMEHHPAVHDDMEKLVSDLAD